jgi:D-tyrosyl-tRNA(Tyr) deacylase
LPAHRLYCQAKIFLLGASRVTDHLAQIMITIVQRVTEASVTVGGEIVGSIGPGLLALAAVVRGDTDKDIAWTAAKLAGLRVFRSDGKHFDKDVKETGGSILLVSNFTVAASTRQGRRPSLDRAAEPAVAEAMFAKLVDTTRGQGVTVATGKFAADMKVSLVNDGPATFILDSSNGSAATTPG